MVVVRRHPTGVRKAAMTDNPLAAGVVVIVVLAAIVYILASRPSARGERLRPMARATDDEKKRLQKRLKQAARDEKERQRKAKKAAKAARAEATAPPPIADEPPSEPRLIPWRTILIAVSTPVFLVAFFLT